MSHHFRPVRGGNFKVSATTSAALQAIQANTNGLRVINVGSNVIYFVTYNSRIETRTATAADTPVGPSTTLSSAIIIQKDLDHDTVSFLAETGATTIHIQPGSV